MAFTREDLAAYEAQPVATPEASSPETEAEPVVETQPEAEASSTTETQTAQTEPASDGSQVEQVEATTTPAELDSETQPTEETNDGSPRKGSAQERIEELVTERNALRKYGEYLLDQLKVKPAPAVEAPAKAPEEAKSTPPTLEEHNYDPVAFNKALVEWNDKEIDRRVAAKVQEVEAKRSDQNVREAFESRTNEFRKQHSDFDLIVSNPSLPVLGQDAAMAI